MTAPDEDDNRFSLQEEISKVFKTSLRRYVPDLPDEEPDIVGCEKKEFGDYYCLNHLTIWNKKRDDDEAFKKLYLISKAIKNNLPASASDMMEECEVVGIGYLCFKLSKKWLAKSIHKMLKDGIDTWAPKLPVKKAVVDFSSRNIAEEVDAGHLRSTIIGDTLVRMLEYSKVDVIRRNCLGDQYGMLIDFLFERLFNGEVNDHLAIGEIEVFYKEWKKRFNEDAEFREIAYQAQVWYRGGYESYQNAWAQICEIDRKGYEKVYQRLGVDVEEKIKSMYDLCFLGSLELLRKKGLLEISGGEVVIFVKEKKPMLPKYRERKKIPLTVVKKDGSYDNALTDLADLWYEVNEEKAEWILYVADLGKEDYIEMCIAAARLAGWLPTDENEYPRTTFVGYGLVEGDDLKRFRTCSTQVVDLLDEAKTRCKAALVEQGKANDWTAEELEHTAEALGYGAVKYADLKKLRFLNFTVNFDEMLNDKGNTGVSLLYTHAQICSIIRKSGKEIEELKKVGKLNLNKDEEHELGLHLLQFTQAVEEACTNAVPDILCEYLYKLSEKWTIFFSECKVIGCDEHDEQTSRLLLCEATAVVMRKCFHLLGITPIHKI